MKSMKANARKRIARRSTASRTGANEHPRFVHQLRDFVVRNVSWFLVAALGLLLLQDIFGTHGVLAMHRSQQQAAEIQREIDRLDAENRKLQDRVRSLKNDPSTIERIAREEMGLARPGEYIFKLPPKTGDASDSTSPAFPAKKQ
jgi:cell division protein FtsB